MRQVGLVADDLVYRILAIGALRDLVEVSLAGSDAPPAEAIVGVLAGTITPETVRRVAEGRPVVLLANPVPADIPGDWLFVNLPCDHRDLRAGVRGALGLGVPTPRFAPGRHPAQNRRASFRGALVGRFLSTLRLVEQDLSVELSDVSLPSEDGPGGLGFHLTTEQVAAVHWEPWFRGDKVSVEINLGTAQGPIPAAAKLVRTLIPTKDATFCRVGALYQLDNPDHQEWIEAVWFRAQRKETHVLPGSLR